MAADEEDLAACRRLCKQGVSADSLDLYGSSALINATQRQCIPIVRLLLRHGADVNLSWSSGITPLDISLWNEGKNYALVKTLLKAGASVHLKNDDGWTVLHWAASSRSPVSILRLLIRAGADVNAVNEEGRSPLMLSAEQPLRYAGQRRVRYLLWKGADVSLTDFYGKTALDYALEHEGPVKLLLRAGATRGQHDVEKEGYMLYNAVNQGIIPLVQVLTEIDVNTRHQGVTALMWAARSGQAYSLKTLLDAGADVNQRDEKGWTPLHFAIHNADLKSLEFLLDAKADVHVTDDNGISALMLAMERADPSIIAHLNRSFPVRSSDRFPAEPKLASTNVMVRYLAAFQRFFAAVIDYAREGDKAGILLGGYLADKLYDVPAMLWHGDPEDWFDPIGMEIQTQHFLEDIEMWEAPQRLLDRSRRILWVPDGVQELQLREDLTDVDLAPLPNMRAYLNWLYDACLYICMIRKVGSRQFAVWDHLEEAWSENAEEAGRMANFNAVIASALLPVPKALVQWTEFNEEQFLDQALRAAERLPIDDRQAWIQYTNAQARQLRLLRTEPIQVEEPL